MIDESKIEGLITPKIKAILPVHVYGNICNVEAIEEIARKYFYPLTSEYECYSALFLCTGYAEGL